MERGWPLYTVDLLHAKISVSEANNWGSYMGGGGSEGVELEDTHHQVIIAITCWILNFDK